MPAVALRPLVDRVVEIFASLDLARPPHVSRLVFDAQKFEHDLSIDSEGDSQLLFHSQRVLISHPACLLALADSVRTVLNNILALRPKK